MDQDLHGCDLERTPLSAVQAAKLVGVTPDVVYQWKRRGLLKAAAMLDGKPVYLGVDVQRVERETRLQRGKSRRTKSR